MVQKQRNYGSSYLYKLYNWCFERNVDDQNKQLKLELKIKLKLELIAKHKLLHDFWRLHAQRTAWCVTGSANISMGRLNRYDASDFQTDREIGSGIL